MKYIYWICVLLIIILTCHFVDVKYFKDKNYRVKIVEVKVEVPKNPIIKIEETYNLENVEHTKRVLTGVTITSYNNHENQTDDTPNITATNRPVREGMVAVSKDFLTNNWAKYGDLVYIDCFNRWYVIEDVMNQRFEKRMDIFLFDKAESLKINKTCNIEIVHITK